MNQTIKIDSNMSEQITTLQTLCNQLENLAENVKVLKFITQKDLAELTGWGMPTVKEVFDDPEFPCCDFGKAKVAEIHAVIEFFSKPRRRNPVGIYACMPARRRA